MSVDDSTIGHPQGNKRTEDSADHQDRPGESRPGDTIAGRYKLLELLGEGGMGAVWLAQQHQPVRRKVAIKLIRPGMDSKIVLARFEAERQALALMEHPNIAQVFDGGVTEQGRPYFVMEYIKGVPLTEYCDQARLSVRERMDLFLSVCRAIQHAHSKGIVHRDLKPSNIMVCLYDGRPVPKVIDFGLARALHQELTERTLHTAHGVMVGTPIYMSPEQAELNNLDVDTRTDVYSLGVVLYELLTGMTPLDREYLQRAAVLEVLRLIREEEAVRPSTRLSSSQRLPAIAAQRSIDPAVLQNVLSGDLDWIVLKALEKQRDRRYDSTASLARDIERYLANESIEARPPEIWYRVSKMLRRNRLQIGAAGVLAAGLLAAGGGLIRGWIAADQAQNRVNETQAQVQKERVAKQRAEEAENAQRLAAERVLADSILSGLGLRESVGLNGMPVEADYAALQAWARIDDEDQRFRILELALSDAKTAMQVARCADDVIHACVGLSPSGRKRLLKLVSDKQHCSDCPREVRAVSCMMAVTLGLADIHGLDDVQQALPTPDWTRRRFETTLWRLLPRLSQSDRDLGLQFLLQSPADPISMTVYLSVTDSQVPEQALATSAEKILEQVFSVTATAFSTDDSGSGNLQRARSHSTLLLPVIKNLPEKSLGRVLPLMVKLLQSPDASGAADQIAESEEMQEDSLERKMQLAGWWSLNAPIAYPTGGADSEPGIFASPENDALREKEIIGAICQAHQLLAQRITVAECSQMTTELLKPLLQGARSGNTGLTPWALKLLLPRLPSDKLVAVRSQLMEIGLAGSESWTETEVLSEIMAATVVHPDAAGLEKLMSQLSAETASRNSQLQLVGPMLVRFLPQMNQQQVQSCWKLMLTEFSQQDAGILHGPSAGTLLAGLAAKLDPPAAVEACNELVNWPSGDGFLLAGTTPVLAAVNARMQDLTSEQMTAIRDRLLVEIEQSASPELRTPLHSKIDPELTAKVLKGFVASLQGLEAAAMAKRLLTLMENQSVQPNLPEIAAPAIEELLQHLEKPVVFEIWKSSLERLRRQAQSPQFLWASASRDALLLKAITTHIDASDVPDAWQHVLLVLRGDEEPQQVFVPEDRLPLLVGPALGTLSSRLDGRNAAKYLQELLEISGQSNLRSSLELLGGNYASMYRGVSDVLSPNLSIEGAYQLADWLITAGSTTPPSLKALTWLGILPRLAPQHVARFWDDLYRESLGERELPFQGMNPIQSLPLCLASEYLSADEAAVRWRRMLDNLENSEQPRLQPALLLVLPSLVKQVPPDELDKTLDSFIRVLTKLSSAVADLPEFSPLAFLTSDRSSDPTTTLLYASLAAPGLSHHLPRSAANRLAASCLDLVLGMPDAKAPAYLLALLGTAADSQTVANALARRNAFGPVRDTLLLRFEELALHGGRSIYEPEAEEAAALADPMGMLRGLRKFRTSDARIEKLTKSPHPQLMSLMSENLIQGSELPAVPAQRQMRTAFDAAEWIQRNLSEFNLDTASPN